MFQYVCNRCKKPIEGSTYYTVDVYGHDINPTNDGRDSTTTYMQNLNEGMSKMLCGEKHYCEECKNKIEDFLKMDDSKTLYFEQTTESNIDIVEAPCKCGECKYSTEGRDWINRVVYRCNRFKITGRDYDDFCSSGERQ